MVPQLCGFMCHKCIDLLNREITSGTITEYLLRMGEWKNEERQKFKYWDGFIPVLGKKSELFESLLSEQQVRNAKSFLLIEVVQSKLTGKKNCLECNQFLIPGPTESNWFTFAFVLLVVVKLCNQ